MRRDEVACQIGLFLVALVPLGCEHKQQQPPTPKGLREVCYEIFQKCAEYDSLTARITARDEMKEPTNQHTLEGQGTCEVLRRGDQCFFRFELKQHEVIHLNGERKGGQNSTTLIVADGEFVYHVVDVDVYERASKGMPDSYAEPWPTGVLMQMLRGFDLRLLPEETLEAKPAYVIEGRFKLESLEHAPEVRWYFQKDTGLPVKVVAEYAEGFARTKTYTDIRVNVELVPERFKFDLPTAAQLTDHTGATFTSMPASGKPDLRAALERVLAEELTIHQAARTGNVEQIRARLAAGTDINAKNATCETPLHIAIAERRYDAAKFLIDAGADISAHIGRPATIVEKDVPGVETIHGAFDRGTALHAAAFQGDRRMVRMLLAHGADPNARADSGQTPLHEAAEGGHQPVVELLLAKGSNLNARNEKGETALHCAAREGHQPVVELLLARGAEVNTPNEKGETPVQVAAAEDRDQMVKLLLARGAQRPADLDGVLSRELLSNAVRQGDAEAVRRLLAEGADVNGENQSGWTPLRDAVEFGRSDIAQLLVAHGANVNAVDGFLGRTPLMWAASRGHKDIVELLLARDAQDVNVKDKGGLTALFWAVTMADPTGRFPYPDSVRARQKEIVGLLLARGADPNVVFENDGTVLHIASGIGERDLVEMLLAKGADPNAQDQQGRRETALHTAAFLGHAPVVASLIAHGAHVDIRERLGSTALEIAARFSHAEVVEQLLAHGADVNTQSNSGHTALHWVASKGDPAMAEILLRAGADATINNKDGHTPMALATQKGHTDVVDVLKRYGVKE